MLGGWLKLNKSQLFVAARTCAAIIVGSADDGQFLYRQVIDLIAENIASGTLRPGDRLPSLRKMSRSVGVSDPLATDVVTLHKAARRDQHRAELFYLFE